MTMEKRILLALLMLVVAASAMMAQDELEQTAKPKISGVIAWGDEVDPQPDSLLVTIENHAANPDAAIYYRLSSYYDEDPESQQWTLYTGPFLIGLWDTVSAYAIADGMSESDQAEFAIPTGYGYDFTTGKIHYAYNYYEDATVLVTSIAGMYGMNNGYLECYAGDVMIPETVVKNGKTYTVIGIESHAFDDQINLKSVTIPKTVQVIHENAFDGCTGLERVNITDIAAWCNIEYDSFFPMSSPLFYARHLFMDGEEIKNLTIPDGVTEIKKWAFIETLSLTSVDIAETVTAIGDGAFGGCNNLTSVISRALTPPNGTNVFIFADGSGDIIYQQATLFVPAESVEAYRAHNEWGKFARIAPFIGIGPGDMNGDGSITVTDVTQLVGMLLSDDDMPAYADVTGDGTANITDVISLINLLLNAE